MKKVATAHTGKKKLPGPTQQMEAVEEGTADNANLSRKKPPKSTQQMKKTSTVSKENDPSIEYWRRCVWSYINSLLCIVPTKIST